ncbi:MAG: ABC transporter ATP-binding protein [Sediminimonas qiaohouensis]|uniref:ABC transporter ATP-binding protein n=1 Tax=Sediminimonas qiaohouensis TaxID=552061 RepID=A0A7C9MBA0_9RHOB|nr:ABC transporter ATP-binding protein [Sediminimonas qiaohouensis]MTJ06101.1 ABC transporter ATP-binding protein [Sediminimonas qiaohouensis]
MLKLNGVTKRYEGVVALDGLDLTVPDDTYLSLLGASGSGKTTLLRLIAGYEEPDEGEVFLNGERLDGKPPHRRDIGFVFQNFALFPHLSVEDNVAFGLRYREAGQIESKAEIRDRTMGALELVGLADFGHRGVGEISGGQRQRVALARTLVTEPRIVLLDEPLGALDANLRARMCDELRAIRERLKVSFLHVTGSETEALTMGDTVAVLADGKIAQIDASRALFTQPKNPAAARHLNAWNILSGVVEGGALRTSVGLLPIAEKVADNTSAQLAVRFDDIGVCDPADVPEAHDHFVASYVTGEFNGPTALSFFRTPDGLLIQVVDHLSDSRLPDLKEGQTYALHFPPEAAVLFKGAA